MPLSKQDIIHFWFEETEPRQWFQKSDDFDAAIRQRFEPAYNISAEGQNDRWRQDVDGVLALCILLDQMPRNMFRDTPKAFATDSKALEIAKEAVVRGFDKDLKSVKRRFLYLPYEHSENLEDQKQCVALFESIRDEDELGYEYALKHLEVIEKFGRFPHRNAILGRENTEAEKEYLAQPGSGF